MMKYVLGADIGSGSVKLTLLSQEGIIAATAGCEYPTHYPHVGWCEQDPEDWCIAFKTAFTNILTDAKNFARNSLKMGSRQIQAVFHLRLLFLRI